LRIRGGRGQEGMRRAAVCQSRSNCGEGRRKEDRGFNTNTRRWPTHTYQILLKIHTLSDACCSLIGSVFILARCQVPLGIFEQKIPYTMC
jgi:hypothetical protein